jgi:hypothetical protein
MGEYFCECGTVTFYPLLIQFQMHPIPTNSSLTERVVFSWREKEEIE